MPKGDLGSLAFWPGINDKKTNNLKLLQAQNVPRGFLFLGGFNFVGRQKAPHLPQVYSSYYYSYEYVTYGHINAIRYLRWMLFYYYLFQQEIDEEEPIVLSNFPLHSHM